MFLDSYSIHCIITIYTYVIIIIIIIITIMLYNDIIYIIILLYCYYCPTPGDRVAEAGAHHPQQLSTRLFSRAGPAGKLHLHPKNMLALFFFLICYLSLYVFFTEALCFGVFGFLRQFLRQISHSLFFQFPSEPSSCSTRSTISSFVTESLWQITQSSPRLRRRLLK